MYDVPVSTVVSTGMHSMSTAVLPGLNFEYDTTHGHEHDLEFVKSTIPSCESCQQHTTGNTGVCTGPHRGNAYENRATVYSLRSEKAPGRLLMLA